MLRRIPVWGLLVAGLCLLATGCAVPEPFRVMSFNVRYATEADGENRWEARREQVYEVIRRRQPAVVGLQEVLAGQADEIRAAFPDYAFVGVGRRDGKRAGEMVPILVDRERFDVVKHGHFWLSPTPEKVGSVGWDAALPRMATWVELRFKEAPMRKVRVVNAHFDHQGERARLESAKLLREFVDTANGGTPVIVVGDFNCAPGSPPHRVLCGGADAEVVDAHACMPLRKKTGTYHGFTGEGRGERIDWILIKGKMEPTEADVDTSGREGRYPSDHFPVWAEVRLTSGQTAGFT